MARNRACPQIIEVTPEYALSRFSLFSNPAVAYTHAGEMEFKSIQQLFYSGCLAQHNLFDGLIAFWESRPEVVDRPSEIQRAVNDYFASRKIDCLPAWLLDAKRMMTRAVLCMTQVENSDVIRTFNNIHKSYGKAVTFVEVTNSSTERIWSSGEKEGSSAALSGNYRGANLYGDLLDQVYHFIFYGVGGDNFDTIPTVTEMLTENILSRTCYRKTAILVSDSTFRHAQEIDGGSIWYQTGVTFGEMAGYIRDLYGNVMNAKYLIVALGTNDARRLDTDRDRYVSLRDFAKVVSPLFNHPEIEVMIHTGIGVRTWDRNGQAQIPDYVVWFRTAFQVAFEGARNFYLCDWSVPGPDNPFMHSDRAPVSGYLDHDGKHPNVSGTRAMWRNVNQEFPQFKQLQAVRFTTSSGVYKTMTLKERRERKLYLY